MIVIRHVFQAKHGQGGALAQAMKAGVPRTASALSTAPCWRVLTDLSGPMDTVVLEFEAESLAEWEQGRHRLFASPEFQEQVRSSGPLMESGRHEFYTIEATG
jgi:hypothetical protein